MAGFVWHLLWHPASELLVSSTGTKHSTSGLEGNHATTQAKEEATNIHSRQVTNFHLTMGATVEQLAEKAAACCSTPYLVPSLQHSSGCIPN